MSVLKEQPDGAGFYYGTHKGHRVNVRIPAAIKEWGLYVDDDFIGFSATKDEAEQRAVDYIDALDRNHLQST